MVLLTSLNCCMSTLRLVHYALLLTPACWKSSNTNPRLMAFALSLALDPTFGIHSHKTLDTAQPYHLSKPNWKPSSSHSISAPTNVNTQSQSVCVCVYVCACMCVHIMPYVNCFGRTDFYVCILYLGKIIMYECSGYWWVHDKCTLLLLLYRSGFQRESCASHKPTNRSIPSEAPSSICIFLSFSSTGEFSLLSTNQSQGSLNWVNIPRTRWVKLFGPKHRFIAVQQIPQTRFAKQSSPN